MKSNFLRKLWLSVITLMLCSAAFGATKYCDTEMTASSHTIQLTCKYLSGSSYQILVKSEDVMTGIYVGTWMHINGGETYQVGAAGNYTVSDNGHTITAPITSNPAPTDMYTGLQLNFASGSDLATYSVPDIDWTATCAPVTDPTISVKPTSIIFSAYDQAETVKVTTANLTENVTITCPAGFEASPATISKDATSTDVTITCKTSSPTEFANVTFTSGTVSATTQVKFRVPETIVFTGGTWQGAGVHLNFEGYGSKYTSTQSEIQKYSATVKSTNVAMTTIEVQACQGDNLYCALNAAPGGSDVTTITLTYENGDCGKVTFTGTTFTSTAACGAVITVDPSSLTFTETNQEKPFSVSAEDLSNNISISSSSANFEVNPTSFTQAEAGGDVTVKFIGTAAENATITVSSGNSSKTVDVSATFNPTLSVNTESLSFNKLGSKTIQVTGAHLTNDIILTSSNPEIFTVSPASISKDATFPYEVTVECIKVEDLDNGTITIESTGATSVETEVTVTVPETIVFTSDSRIEGNQAKLVFTGYNGKYICNTTKYTASVKSTCPTVTSINIQDAPAAYLYCPLSAGPGANDITIISLEYENGDCGKVFFQGGTFLATAPAGPSVSTDKSELSYTAQGQVQEFTVLADVDVALTVSSNNDNFVVSQSSITAGTIKSTISVTFNGSSADNATITISGGGVSTTVTASAAMTPTLTATPSSLLYTSAEGKTVSVGASSLSENVTLTLSGDGASHFSLSKESISKSETFPYNVTVTYDGDATATATLTISSTGAESQTVSLTGYNNTACSGYKVAAAGAGSAAQDIPYTYSITQTPAGHVTFTFTFTSVPTGFVPQININGKGWRTMSGDLKRTYTTTADDFDDGVTPVAGDKLTYQFYAAYENGTSSSELVEYTLGDCPTVLIEIGGKSYTTLADAIADYTEGNTISILGDVNESNTIDEHVLINANAHNIGNITVGTEGKLEFVTNGAAMKTFVVQNIPGTGAGQVVTNGNTITAEAAYLEREIYSGDHEELWYSFGVPFTVDARNGVYSAAGKKVNYGQYYIQEYDGANRAEYGILKYGQKGYAWSEVSTLEKGTGYMIYLMASCPNTLRFKASDASDLFTNVYAEQVNATKYTGSADATNHGWNFMAQPRMQNAGLQAGDGLPWGGDVVVQVLLEGGSDAEDYSGPGYTSQPSGSLIMTPFTTFMLQAGGNGFLNFIYNASDDPTLKSAEDVEYKYFIVTLANEAGKSDNFFASASEDALEDEYQLGRDLIKCGSSDSRLQICSEAFGQILTANDVKAYDGVGDMSLRLSIPKAGNYSIQVTRPASSGEIFLTKDGDVIADLTDGEAYEFASAKGVNKEYGLRIVLDEEITTDASEADAEVSVYANDGIIYVNGVKAADVMNLLGQRVANPVAEGGIYLVNAGGKYVKINVE